GIRDWSVTGVQTCALPICRGRPPRGRTRPPSIARAFVLLTAETCAQLALTFSRIPSPVSRDGRPAFARSPTEGVRAVGQAFPPDLRPRDPHPECESAVAEELGGGLEAEADAEQVQVGSDPAAQAGRVAGPVQQGVVVALELVGPELRAGQQAQGHALPPLPRQGADPTVHLAAAGAAAEQGPVQ